MVKYKKTYIEHFGYYIGEWIGCEICNNTSVDIHHLDIKGMGGTTKEDEIEDLIAVCRTCHDKCHDHPEFNKKAVEIHLKNL